jgi:hypothetical protein
MDRLSNGPFYNDGLARNSNTNNFPAGLIVNRNYPLDSRNSMTTAQICEVSFFDPQVSCGSIGQINGLSNSGLLIDSGCQA